MGRPRRPFGGQETIEASRDRWLGSQASTPLGVRQRARWDSSQHWGYRYPNGQYDPLTHLHVLDAVANIDPDIELRSAKLAEHLNQTRQQFSWDPVTVGKVLSDLHEAFEDALGRGHGILDRGKDYRGFFFRIHHNQATADLYHALREDLMRLGQAEMTARAIRAKSDRLASPLLECPSLRGEFVEL